MLLLCSIPNSTCRPRTGLSQLVHIILLSAETDPCPGRVLGLIGQSLRATSPARLRARDHHTSGTLVGGKGGASPSSLLHTTLEGPTEYMYVNARWMESLHGFLHGIEWIMFLGHLDYCQNPSLEGRPYTKPPGDHGIPNAHNR